MRAEIRSGHVCALVCALVVSVGCMTDEVDASGIGIDNTTQGLALASLQSANGTYGGGCSHHSGSWSVAIASGATLDNAQLSVVKANSGCVLTLTSLHTTSGIVTASPAITLGTSYIATSSSFGGGFYANAKLSAVDFNANFVLSVLFSDDPGMATATNTAGIVVENSNLAQTASVASPNYTLSVAGLSVVTDVNNVMQTATGSATVTAGSVTGQTYAIVAAGGLVTFSQIDAKYLAATTHTIASSIPAADFALIGTDISTAQPRTLIIANTVNGVRSYQTFEVTFHAAP
jgi:hypothetical protein